jgi:hypothetical protein
MVLAADVEPVAVEANVNDVAPLHARVDGTVVAAPPVPVMVTAFVVFANGVSCVTVTVAARAPFAVGLNTRPMLQV